MRGERCLPFSKGRLAKKLFCVFFPKPRRPGRTRRHLVYIYIDDRRYTRMQTRLEGYLTPGRSKSVFQLYAVLSNKPKKAERENEI